MEYEGTLLVIVIIIIFIISKFITTKFIISKFLSLLKTFDHALSHIFGACSFSRQSLAVV